MDAIRALVLEDAGGRTRPGPPVKLRLPTGRGLLLWFSLVEALGWGGAFWGLSVNLDWVAVAGVGVALLVTVAWCWPSLRQFRANWQRRRQDSVELANRAVQAHQALTVGLLPFGRASLNYVADEYRDRDARVTRRTSLVVGSAQAGGVLGLIGLGIAATAALQRAFSDNALMSRPIREVVWVVLLVVLSRSVTALLVRHSNGALLNDSDILRRVGGAKALLDQDGAAGSLAYIHAAHAGHGAEYATAHGAGHATGHESEHGQLEIQGQAHEAENEAEAEQFGREVEWAAATRPEGGPKPLA